MEPSKLLSQLDSHRAKIMQQQYSSHHHGAPFTQSSQPAASFNLTRFTQNTKNSSNLEIVSSKIARGNKSFFDN